MFTSLIAPKFLVSFMKGLHKLKSDHPVKKLFDDALNEYALEEWGRPLVKDAKAEINPAECTIQELRDTATILFQEAERLEALPDQKRLYAVRKDARKDFEFIDNTEKAARMWALENPDDAHVLYDECWVNDPLKEGKRRCIRRTKMDIPTITAKDQSAAKQTSTQRKQ